MRPTNQLSFQASLIRWASDPFIDWARHAGLYYVVIDPMTPGHLLYLTESQYLSLVRICMSNEKTLRVLATPESSPPSEKEEDSGHDTKPKASPSVEQPPVSSPDPVPSPSQDGTKPTTIVPRWRQWIRRLVSPLRKKEGESKLRIVGSMVFPTQGNLAWLWKTWGTRVLSFCGKPYLSVHPSQLQSTASFLVSVLKSRGLTYLIRYLKASYVIVCRYLAGNVVTNPHELGTPVKLANGLPSWLPLSWRARIRRRDINFLRFILSMLYLYKSFGDPQAKPDFTTVTAAPYIPTSLFNEFASFVGEFLTKLGFSRPVRVEQLLPTWRIITTSGANLGISSLGAYYDLFAWKLAFMAGRCWLYDYMSELTRLLRARTHVSTTSALYLLLFDQLFMYFNKEIPEKTPFGYRFWRLPDYSGKRRRDRLQKGRLGLGKIAIQPTAGGKVRIFAIPDFWSQLLLRPVHKLLEEVLQRFGETDATFNQQEAVDSFARMGYTTIYSFDLKAATDLIPQQLYMPLMSRLLGPTLANLWLKLLTDRSYLYDPVTGKYATGGTSYRYTRGQPMGAYSSWPSMAVVHHLLVRFAAHKAGLNPYLFAAYRVLGDDVVIADRSVALSYEYLCSDLGITLSPTKAFISDLPLRGYRKGADLALFGFASQVFLGSHNISPITLKADVMALTPEQRLEFALTVLRRWSTSELDVIRLLRLLLPVDASKTVITALDRGQQTPFGGLALRSLCSPSMCLRFENSQNTQLPGTTYMLYTWLCSFTGQIPPLASVARACHGVINVRFTSLQLTILNIVLRSLLESLSRTAEALPTNVSTSKTFMPLDPEQLFISWPRLMAYVHKLNVRRVAGDADAACASIASVVSTILDRATPTESVVNLFMRLLRHLLDLLPVETPTVQGLKAAAHGSARTAITTDGRFVPAAVFRHLIHIGKMVDRIPKSATKPKTVRGSRHSRSTGGSKRRKT